MANEQKATSKPQETAAEAGALEVPIDELLVTDDPYWTAGPPYDLFKRLRSECPVHWTPEIREYPDEEGYWSVTTADDIHAVSHDWQTYSSGRGVTALTDSVLPLDVYVNSSIHEGVSLTILEAMATSRAVIATRVGGNPEVVIDGQTGLLVPARDVEALATALGDLACAPARSMALGEAGRARVLERFTIDRMVAQYLNAYAKSAH